MLYLTLQRLKKQLILPNGHALDMEGGDMRAPIAGLAMQPMRLAVGDETPLKALRPRRSSLMNKVLPAPSFREDRAPTASNAPSFRSEHADTSFRSDRAEESVLSKEEAPAPLAGVGMRELSEREEALALCFRAFKVAQKCRAVLQSVRPPHTAGASGASPKTAPAMPVGRPPWCLKANALAQVASAAGESAGRFERLSLSICRGR